MGFRDDILYQMVMRMYGNRPWARRGHRTAEEVRAYVGSYCAKQGTPSRHIVRKLFHRFLKFERKIVNAA